VAAGHAEDHRRGHDARPDDDALFDGVVQCGVTTHVRTTRLHGAQRGEAGVQRLLRVGQGMVGTQAGMQRQMMPDDVLAAHGVHREVHVGIHEARHERFAVEIDDLRAGRPRRAVSADRDDADAVDDDAGVVEQGRGDAVKDARTKKSDGHRFTIVVRRPTLTAWSSAPACMSRSLCDDVRTQASLHPRHARPRRSGRSARTALIVLGVRTTLSAATGSLPAAWTSTQLAVERA
jgi:hypothetical protein